MRFHPAHWGPGHVKFKTIAVQAPRLGFQSQRLPAFPWGAPLPRAGLGPAPTREERTASISAVGAAISRPAWGFSTVGGPMCPARALYGRAGRTFCAKPPLCPGGGCSILLSGLYLDTFLRQAAMTCVSCGKSGRWRSRGLPTEQKPWTLKGEPPCAPFQTPASFFPTSTAPPVF